MAEKCGVLPHVLSKVLNHTMDSRDASRRMLKVYNRYEYFEEKREALGFWAQYVLTLTKTDKPKPAKAASA
jgi:hypothetical protein